MDAFGRIFGLDMHGTIYQIDPTTGAAIAADETLSNGTILLPYDGALYILAASYDGVLRYDLATKTLQSIGGLFYPVWEASAMACVHAPAEPDAGADAADAAPE
jgi:hypothetical protein